MSHHFSSIDVAILIVYILATLYIGLRHARKQKSLDAYFFADRNIPWWAAGISIVAADTSVVSYIGQPAYVYQKDLQLLVAMLIVLPVIWVTVAVWFIPFLARLHLYTIYQYLEHGLQPSYPNHVLVVDWWGWISSPRPSSIWPRRAMTPMQASRCIGLEKANRVTT